MRNDMVIHISFQNLLFSLFCLYAFSLPFELILEIWFNIDTIFKPFRVIALMILGVFGLKMIKLGAMGNLPKADFILIGAFIYGLIISFYRIISDVFNIGLFYNDLFLTGLNFITYLIYKVTPLSYVQARRIFYAFVLGIVFNSIYISYQIFFKFELWRQSGFTDNPNYVAFGLVGAMTYLLLRLKFVRGLRIRILHIGVLIFLAYTFSVQGSRTSFVILLVSFVLIFFYSPLKSKVVLVLGSAAVLFLLLFSIPKNGQLSGPNILLNRLTNTLNSSDEDVRFVVWRGMITMFEDVGFAGLGIGQFKARFKEAFSQESNKVILEMVNRGYYLSPHNDYLAILIDYGLPSLLCFLVFFGIVLRQKWMALRGPPFDGPIILVDQFSFIFLVCMLIFGLAAENFQHQLYWFFLMFVAKTYTNEI